MLHSFGKNVLVFIPEYALKEVHNSQMIGISQINASTAINKLCNTIEEVLETIASTNRMKYRYENEKYILY